MTLLVSLTSTRRRAPSDTSISDLLGWPSPASTAASAASNRRPCVQLCCARGRWTSDVTSGWTWTLRHPCRLGSVVAGQIVLLKLSGSCILSLVCVLLEAVQGWQWLLTLAALPGSHPSPHGGATGKSVTPLEPDKVAFEVR